MIPNPDIWGSPDTWRAPNYLDDGGEVCDRIGGRLPVFDSSLEGNQKFWLKTGIDVGKLIYGQPLDASCCPWRIKGDSYWISGVKQLSFAGRDNPILEYAYTRDTRGNGCPLMISPLTTLDGCLFDPLYIWQPDYTQPGYDTPVTLQQTSPLLQFDYSKIVIVPSIRASETPGGTTTRYGLDEYINGAISTKPYIQSLNFRVWTRDSNNVMRDSDGMLKLHPFGAVTAGANVSMPALAEDYITYQSMFDGDSYNVSGHGDSFVDLNPDLIKSSSKDTNDAIYNNGHKLLYIACPEDAEITIDTSEWEVRASWQADAEWITRQYAMLGFWVWAGGDGTGTSAGAPNAWDPTNPDEHTIIPIFDDYGTTTGDYLRGAAALTAPAATWTTNVFSDDIYHGEPPYDPTNYDDDNKTIFNTISIQNKSQNVYVFTQSNSNDPLTYLYATSFDSAEAQFAVKNFLSVSPIDCVQSVMFFPINIVEWVGTTDSTQYIYSLSEVPEADVVYGNVKSEIKARKLNDRTAILDMGYIDIYRKFNDFRDFEPYTSIMLYVPFCGYTQIDCSTFMGKRLKIKYIIDFITGGCTACILANNLCVQTVNGQMGVQIPVTGAQTAQIRQAFDAAQLQYKQSQMSTAASIAGLTIGVAATIATQGATAPMLGMAGTNAISTLIGAQKAEQRLDFELSHMTTPFKTVGGTSSAIGFQMELTPRAIITRPKMLAGYNAEVYGATNGYACCSTGKLSQYSGYTQCASVVLDGINATAEEKIMLNTLLLKGVIL